MPEVTALHVTVLPDTYAICRLEPAAAIPDWAGAGGFTSVTRTPEELSVLCRQSAVPDDVLQSRDWRVLRVRGPLDFALTGVLAALVVPLARADISVFALSTYETDYLLVREDALQRATQLLQRHGHQIVSE